MISTNHDNRPRVHIWPTRQGYAWSMGPRGNQRHHADLGDCAQDALVHVGDRPFVIIVEPRA